MLRTADASDVAARGDRVGVGHGATLAAPTLGRVDAPFSVTVSSADWRQEVEGWIRERAAEDGREVTGAFEQPRIRPWSTQLVVPTDRGRLWFKANCAALAFEPAVQWALADIAPTEVDRPVAIDAQPRLDAHRRPRDHALRQPRADPRRLVSRRAQRGAAAAGGSRPRCPPAVGGAARLLARVRAGPARGPGRALVRAAARAPLPPRRARRASRSSRLGTACPPPPGRWPTRRCPRRSSTATSTPTTCSPSRAACASSTSATPTGPTPQRCSAPRAAGSPGSTTLPWRAIEQAYLEAWDLGLTTDDLEELLRAASLCTPVNRSLTWWSAMTEATDEEWQHWATVSDEYLLALARPID